jgi:hypothetical protein
MVLIDELEVDATIKQDHTAEAEVTEHPVEQGADPSDHIRRRADTLSLDCVISSTPLGPNTNDGLAVAEGLAPRVVDAYAYLRRAMDDGRLLTITTTLRVYQNMVLLSLRPSRDSKTGDALTFQAQFKQVRIVNNLRIEKPTTDLRVKGKTDLRKQPTTPAPAPAEGFLFKWSGGKSTFGGTP